MRRFVVAIITASSMAAVGLGSAGSAAAAPSDPSSPSDIIRRLEARGYQVIVTTIAGNNAQQCSIAAVRPGHTTTGHSEALSGVSTTDVLHKTIYVDLRC